MIRFEEALHKLRPNTEWVCYGGTLEGLTFMDKSIKKPTQEEIDAAIEQIKADKIQEELDKAAKKTAAEAKLAALGLTSDDLKALGL